MRGLPSYYTKVLIDGVDVSDSSLMQPSYNFANLTVDDIEKIEIVQGAQSGLYGSNAVGGVINIITKKDTANRILNIHKHSALSAPIKKQLRPVAR